MKVITLISGGDSGGAKPHDHSLLQNLSRTIEVTMVCFLEGPFAQEARELGIPTVVLSGRNLLRTYRTLKRMIREGGYQLIHCHGARGNMMRALLRRSAGRADPIIERGALRISPATREVTFNGEPVILSSKEYALLAALAERQGVVWSRSQLEEKLYNCDNTVVSNAIEVHIHHLRKKLSDNAIKTARGVGYLLET